MKRTGREAFRRSGAAVVVCALAMLLAGCPAPEQMARDAIAGAKGAIQTQQEIHLAECQATPALTHCQNINRAVDAQNAAIDALHIYCAGPAYEKGTGPCEPPTNGDARKQAEEKLRAVVLRLSSLITRIQGAAR